MALRQRSFLDSLFSILYSYFMEEELTFVGRLSNFITKNPLFVGVLGIGVILCAIGVYQYINSQNSESELRLITADTTEPVAQNITVDVQGQVNQPGVYTLPPNSRIKNAIDAAGGLAEGADQEYISRMVNLAQKISDGTKIYIPVEGEMESESTVFGVTTAADQVVEDVSAASTGLLNINNASLEALETLPRIGPVTAQKIIDGRPYGIIEELVSKKILGQKTFDGLKDRIVAQ